MRLPRLFAIIFTKATFVTGLYIGTVYHQDINKLWLNTFERRTPVAEGYYENIGDLNVFLDKKEGKFVPSYGTETYRVEIGEDMLPKGIERKIETNTVYIPNRTICTPVIDTISDSEKLANMLNHYINSEGEKRDSLKKCINEFVR